MPTWNLGQIISDATHRMGRRVDIPKSVVSRYANQAYLDIAEITRTAHAEKLAISSTTSGENRYELPADFLEIINLSWLTNIGSSRTLSRTNPHEVDAKGFTPVGVPSKYVLYNNWLELYPSPNSAYSLQLRYRSRVTTMLELNDVPSVETSWRFPIVLKTESYLHQWVGDPERAAAAHNAYAIHVSTLETAQAKRNRSPNMRVKVIW